MAYLSTRSFEQFHCTGDECPDTCCRGWSIQVTNEDRARLEQALTKAPAPLRPLTDELVPAPHQEPGAIRLFVMHFDDHGNCPYLTEDQKCQIHASLGDEVLPGVCAQYPREAFRFGEQREIWLAMSCPEAVRLGLLGEHGADLVELPDVAHLRYVNEQLDITDATPDYVAYLDEVRRFVHELLALEPYSLRARQFFVAYFAHRTNSYFHAQAKAIDRRRLLQDMRTLRDRALLDQLATELDAVNVPGTYAISLVQSVIQSRSGMSIYPERGPVGSPDAAPAANIDPSLATADWLNQWLDYSTSRARWETEFSPLLEQAFENYCKIFWMKEWFFRSPNLLAHASTCMLRVAILRYRLFTHPALESLTAESTQQERRALLESTLLQVVTEMARSIEHDRPFQASLNSALGKRGMLDLAHASLLLLL